MIHTQHLVLSGGGFKGFAYVGAFHEIKKIYSIDWGAQAPALKSITGCSIGALIGLLLVLGYGSAELDHMVMTTDFQSMIKIDYGPGSVSLDSGHVLREFVEEKISQKIFNTEARDLTLEQLYKKRNTLFRIAAINLETGMTELFDAESMPHVKVVDAIMASVGLPPIFPPVEICNTLYADAGLVDYFPIKQGTEHVPESEAHTILGLRLQSTIDLSTIKTDLKKSMFPFAVYMKHIYDVATTPMYESYWNLIPKYLQQRTVTIHTPEANVLEAGLNPALVQQARVVMLQAGINSVRGNTFK